MKKEPLKSMKFCSLLVIALLAIIIFTPACQDETEYRPSARFVLKGTVLSDPGEEPLNDILVIMSENRIEMISGNPVITSKTKDSAITDNQGFFVVTDSLAIPAATVYTLTFKDPNNRLKSGEINNISKSWAFIDPIFINGDNHWYAGEIMKDSTFLLKTK